MIYEDYDSGIKDVAYRVTNNKRIFAVDATKADGPFYCPDTYEELIVRKCIEKRDHFAYRARQSPVARRESDLHLNCKKELLEMERNGFSKDKVKGYKKVRPDLSGRINGRGIIIEVQASTLSISKILERTEQYAKRGAHILWIVPLEEELGKDGTMHTVGFTLEYSRFLFAYFNAKKPGYLDNHQTKGNQMLISESKAIPISSEEEIFNAARMIRNQIVHNQDFVVQKKPDDTTDNKGQYNFKF